jgi:uncharacterized coiled-coil protein SlyX
MYLSVPSLLNYFSKSNQRRKKLRKLIQKLEDMNISQIKENEKRKSRMKKLRM